MKNESQSVSLRIFFVLVLGFFYFGFVMRYWQILYHFLEIFRIFLMSSIDKRLKHVLIYTINRKKFFFFSHLPFLCSIFGACIRFMSVKSSSLKNDPKMVRIEGEGETITYSQK